MRVVSSRRSRLTRTGHVLAALTAFQLFSACGGAEPGPSSAEDVRRAFASEGVRLTPSPVAAENAEWATLLVGEEDVDLQVQVYAAPEAAQTFASSFDALLRAPVPRISLAGRPSGPRPEPPLVRRQGNVLVLAPARTAAALTDQIERALARLPAA